MIGQKLNSRYTITAHLGEGAIGEVFRATDEQSGQQVAVKVLARQLTMRPDSLERFRREAETLRQLDHPNIVKFVDAFEHAGQYVIVMEYVHGGSLHELIQHGLLPADRARQITLDLCDALIRAHRLNIIHRDIKPENVLITTDGISKLADFGVARLSDGASMTRSGTQVGTPYYMSPEAWEGKALDAQADIWSLGVLLFELLTGQLPFVGDTSAVVMNKVLTSQAPDLKKVRPETPSDLIKITARMLARDKSKRYQTMREVAVDLERRQHPRPVAPSKTRLVQPNGFFRLSWLLWGLVVLLGILVITGIAYNAGRATKQTPVPTVILDSVDVTVVAVTSTAILNNDLPVTSEKDGMILLFVPRGDFTMGSDFNADEKPTQQINLDAFWIDQTEVTNVMYAKCVADGGCNELKNSSSATRPGAYYGVAEFDNYPVIHVDWNMANVYCLWAGRVLPSEAQWEKAARGPSTSSGNARTYPWGDQLPNADLLNYNNDLGDTAEVGRYPDGASVYGALDMAGNVWEWTSSVYKPYPYDARDGREDLSSSDSRVLRGGAWSFNGNYIRTANRIRSNQTNAVDDRYGFRCAKNEE